jgi:NADH:ubiquinone oxidoreductase subunit 1 (chain H)
MGTAPAQLFPEFLVDTFGLPGVLGEVVASLIGAALVANIILAFSGIAGPWAKRKITAAFTDRIAVNRIGPFGLLIIPAAAVQLLAKELIIPEGSTARRGISLRSSCRRRRCSGSP